MLRAAARLASPLRPDAGRPDERGATELAAASGFLDIARRTGVETFDLLEIGPSAGLNLVWDRYRYRYEQGTWGSDDAKLELSGEERRPIPPQLLRLAPRVRQRRGIDLAPLDVTRPGDALLLKSFVWADQHQRLDRLDRAVQTLRADPPSSSAVTLSNGFPSCSPNACRAL